MQNDHELIAGFRGRPFYKKLSALIQWLNAHHLSVRLLVSVAVGISSAMAFSILTHLVLYWCGVFPPLHKPMFDTRLVLISLAYHSLYAVAAAYLAAYLARRRARKAVLIIGSKEAIIWVLGIVLLWKHSPPWYNLTKAVLGIPLALLGGWLYTRHKRKKEARGLSPGQDLRAW